LSPSSFGHLSLSEIRKSAGRLAGKGPAIAGLVLGYLAVTATAVVLIIAVLGLPRARKAGVTTRVSPRVTTHQPSAVSALRTLNTAEIAYVQEHPAAGYTCSLADLSGAWGSNGDLAQVKKNGYLIAIQGCAAAKANGPLYEISGRSVPGATEQCRIARIPLESIRRHKN
jgi:hypothetical protein